MHVLYIISIILLCAHENIQGIRCCFSRTVTRVRLSRARTNAFNILNTFFFISLAGGCRYQPRRSRDIRCMLVRVVLFFITSSAWMFVYMCECMRPS